MMDLPAFLPALPEIFLACAAMVLMMVGVFQREEKALGIVTTLALLSIVITAILVMTGEGGRNLAMFDLFVADDFGVFMKILILLGSFLAIVMSHGYIHREGMARFEYPVLIVFATLGMLLMVSANDLISLYIGLELQSLSLYVIAAFQRDTLRSSESGLKYFVLGALSSGLLLYGMSMIYGFSGHTQFDALAGLFTTGVPVSEGLIVGIVFLIAGLAFKVSAVPFHMWTPDVYEGAPTPVTAFFAVAPKVAAMALLLRVMLGPFGDLIGEWQQVLYVVSIASMTLGALAAIAQTNIKRLMAYSSIGHIGYALMGLVAGTESGVQGVLIYLSIYLVMNVGTFACILSMKVQGRMVEGIDDLAGLGKTRPMMALALMVFMFSMAGIPPLAGFFGKFFVFAAALEAELYTLAIFGAVTSVIAAVYYLRIIKIMYFDEAAETLDAIDNWRLRWVMGVAGAITATMFIYMEIVTDPAAIAAVALLG